MKKSFFLLILFTIFCYEPIFGQKPISLNKLSNQHIIQDSRSRTKFNINNISTWVYANGDMDIKPDGNSGFEFPRGSGKAAIYESGFVWGGEYEGKVHVSGSTYEQGLLPGRVLEDGTPQNPEEPTARVYRVRPDFSYNDLSSEIRDENKTYEEVFNNYQKDWNEWPADWGAPYNDIDDDGKYNPTIDIPGVPGAHQTLWYVANDFDVETCRKLFGTDPMKIELQVTIWGYNIPQSIYNNVMFKKYKLINKNDVDIDSMYISQFADIDLGDAGDDFAGCDSLLNLMYCYNGYNYDAKYGALVPAIGFQLLQGPITKSANTDKALYNNSYKFGYKNIEMKSHYFYIGGDPVFNDPDIGEYNTGALQFFNLLKGRVTTTGQPFIDPVTQKVTKFTLSGNPLTNEGWVDGILHSPENRRNGFASGPFELAVGDTQEVVIAQFAEMGTDRLNSLYILKQTADILQSSYPENNDLSLLNVYRSVNNLKPSIEQNIYSEYDIIEINIDRKDSVENFSEDNFEFQGYNIYQFVQESRFNKSGNRLFTLDKIDDISVISADIYDPIISSTVNEKIYEGTNSGLSQKIRIEKDYILDSKLIKGKTYYYGLTAYLYNKEKNKTIESAPYLISIIFQEDLPGANYLDKIEPETVIGNSDLNFSIEIVDPEKLTGDTYEIIFGEQHYYYDADGEWKKTRFADSVGTALSKPSDQTLSELIPLPSIYSRNQTIDLNFEVKLNSPDFNWVDGVRITFPDGIQINSAVDVHSNHDAFAVINGQTVTWGTEDTTADGAFTGGEDISVNIDFIEPTFTIEYEIFDDGWSEFFMENSDPNDSTYYNLGNGTVNGKGSVELTGEIGYHFKTEKYWELTNISTNSLLIEQQDIYTSVSSYYPQNRYVGPENIFEGFLIKSLEFYGPTKSFNKIIINGEIFEVYSEGTRVTNDRFSITDYTLFGISPGTSLAKNGYGTDDVDKLSQDYEFRFTGERDSTTINGNKVYITKDGTGSLATMYGSRQYDISQHPLNTFGRDRFLVRVPLEVWNKDLGIQVNYQIYDRDQIDPNADGFYVWNINGRMYCEVLNTPYNGKLITEEMTTTLSDDFTWMNVWYKSNYKTGDVVEIKYKNPIKLTDVFRFTTPEAPADKISPNKYQLFQNYPNPFNPNTKIRYFIPEEGNVKITIYNILGQKVTEVINKTLNAGKYETEFNGSNFASGVYIYRIEVDSPDKANVYSKTKKMLLLK